MAEILLRATDSVHPNAVTDRRGCYKVGMPVVVRPDGWQWGTLERWPAFALVKVPLVAVDHPRLVALLSPQYDEFVPAQVYRRRRWMIRASDLPQNAWRALRDNALVIKAHPDYTGTYHYTWAQVRNFWRDLQTGTDGYDL